MHMYVHIYVCLVSVTTRLMTERLHSLMKGMTMDHLIFLLSFTSDDSNNDNYHYTLCHIFCTISYLISKTICKIEIIFSI